MLQGRELRVEIGDLRGQVPLCCKGTYLKKETKIQRQNVGLRRGLQIRKPAQQWKLINKCNIIHSQGQTRGRIGHQQHFIFQKTPKNIYGGTTDVNLRACLSSSAQLLGLPYSPSPCLCQRSRHQLLDVTSRCRLSVPFLFIEHQ